jgi:hypothetical protein
LAAASRRSERALIRVPTSPGTPTSSLHWWRRIAHRGSTKHAAHVSIAPLSDFVMTTIRWGATNTSRVFSLRRLFPSRGWLRGIRLLRGHPKSRALRLRRALARPDGAGLPPRDAAHGGVNQGSPTQDAIRKRLPLRCLFFEGAAASVAERAREARMQ